jgi:acyl-coenzyme A synthetase/AMP-(fatty) acid ligase
MNGVEDVTVGGERHPLTGHIVKAKVRLSTGETLADFRKRMRAFCQDKLPTYKVPQKVILASEPLHSERYKKLRAE